MSLKRSRGGDYEACFVGLSSDKGYMEYVQ
jgi:hypothetical protein